MMNLRILLIQLFYLVNYLHYCMSNEDEFDFKNLRVDDSKYFLLFIGGCFTMFVLAGIFVSYLLRINRKNDEPPPPKDNLTLNKSFRTLNQDISETKSNKVNFDTTVETFDKINEIPKPLTFDNSVSTSSKTLIISKTLESK